MLRIPYFLDNQLKDGGEVCRPYAPAALYPQEDSWFSFLLEDEWTPDLEGFGSIANGDLILK
jgi:hypothetical protein